MEDDRKVVLIHGSAAVNTDIADILRRFHEVEYVAFDDTELPDFTDCLLIVVDVDLTDRQTIWHLRDVFKLNALAVPRLFVLNEPDRRAVFQMHALGGQDFVSRPLRPAELLPMLRNLVNSSVVEGWKRLNPVQQSALKVSLKVFDDMMTKAFSGEPLPAVII